MEPIHRYPLVTTEDRDTHHAQFLLDLRLDPEVGRNLGTILDTKQLTVPAILQWMRHTHEDTSKGYEIICNSFHTPIGLLRVDEIDTVNRSARIGLDIAKEFRGKGIGQCIFNAMIQYYLYIRNIRRLWLLVLETNERAIHIYSKLGFKEEGRQREAIYRDGNYVDYISMSFIKEQ